jgi:hypothetical protein
MFEVVLEQCERCDVVDELIDGYCGECHEWEFCECGQALGEYAGEGFCKSCQ